MNEIIQSERNVTINGLACRAQNVIVDIDTHWISNQTIIASKYFIKGGVQYRITVQMRFDDQCKNGHSSFAITGEIDMKSGSRWIDDCSGCIHDEIAAHFPELAPLIKWHLMSTDGPMHYVANTCYLAGKKEREFDAARHAAIWPDATDHQLSLPRADLEELLNARLPGLLAEFKLAMVETCGFIWSV